MKVNFYLQNPKDKISRVFLVSFVRKRRFKFYTTLSLPSKHWDKRRQRVKITGKFPDYQHYNQYLDYLQAQYTEKYFELMRTPDGPTIAALKMHMNKITFKVESNAISLIDYWQQLIERRTEDPAFSPGTVKTYVTARRHFIAFCDLHGEHSFEDINLDFIEKFKIYLFGKQLSINYVEKTIQQLRVMLNQALEQGITDNTEFQKKSFTVKKTKTDEQYLSLDELKRISTLDLSGTLADVRDCFLIQAFTGVSFNDIHKINKNNLSQIDGTNVLRYYRAKTKKMAALPVHPVVAQIMDQHHWEALKPITNQPFNRYIKEIAKAAGITQLVEKKNYAGGIEKIDLLEKYKLIYSHTGRRSFTTNYILSGGTKEEIKLMIGHAKQDVTETYIKAEMQKRAALLATRSFFA